MIRGEKHLEAQPKSSTQYVFSLYFSPLTAFFFLPLLVAVSIATSGCRFWLPLGRAKPHKRSNNNVVF
jgi:hypothetical protein